jgi:hypothetical protein
MVLRRAQLPEGSSAHTQAVLDWQPVQPGLIADMESGHYFASV